MPTTDSGPRERILETASQLFFRHGYCATGINRIIADSEVARASFYTHFTSKEQLAIAWLERRETRWIQQFRARIARQDAIEGRIAAMYSMWQDQIREEGYRGCGFINMAGEFSDEQSPIRTQVRAHKERVRAIIAEDVLDEYRHSMNADDFEALVNTLYSLFDSAIIQVQSLMSDWPIASAEQASLTLIDCHARRADESRT